MQLFTRVNSRHLFPSLAPDTGMKNTLLCPRKLVQLLQSTTARPSPVRIFAPVRGKVMMHGTYEEKYFRPFVCVQTLFILG